MSDIAQNHHEKLAKQLSSQSFLCNFTHNEARCILEKKEKHFCISIDNKVLKIENLDNGNIAPVIRYSDIAKDCNNTVRPEMSYFDEVDIEIGLNKGAFKEILFYAEQNKMVDAAAEVRIAITGRLNKDIQQEQLTNNRIIIDSQEDDGWVYYQCIKYYPKYYQKIDKVYQFLY